MVTPDVQNLQDMLTPLECPRSSELRMLQEPVFETLFTQTGRLAQYTGQEPHARLDHQLGRRLAAGEHRIPDGDLLEPAGFDHPLVHPLEPATKE